MECFVVDQFDSSFLRDEDLFNRFPRLETIIINHCFEEADWIEFFKLFPQETVGNDNKQRRTIQFQICRYNRSEPNLPPFIQIKDSHYEFSIVL